MLLVFPFSLNSKPSILLNWVAKIENFILHNLNYVSFQRKMVSIQDMINSAKAVPSTTSVMFNINDVDEHDKQLLLQLHEDSSNEVEILGVVFTRFKDTLVVGVATKWRDLE